MKNKIEEENKNPGTREWLLTSPNLPSEIVHHRSPKIEGYASATSVNLNQEISFHVSTKSPSFSLKIYRLGWYGGAGGRLMEGFDYKLGGKHYDYDETSKIVECKWPAAKTIKVPANWTSGCYVAKLTASEGKQSYIVFIVRDDEYPAKYLFQSSVTTFQAYNNWGGSSTYPGNSPNGTRARVSFNRPYLVMHLPIGAAGAGAGELLTRYHVGLGNGIPSAAWEYNMIRWLERNGYDVSYCTNIDVHADPALLSPKMHKAFLSVGHDEYWTREMRLNVEAAIAAGINVGFFSANSIYWQVRLEPSPTTLAPNRVMVAYKDNSGWQEDPVYERITKRTATVTERTPYANVTNLFSRVNWPEETLLGSTYRSPVVNIGMKIVKPEHWVCKNSNIAPGETLDGVLGYETGFVTGDAPAGLQVIGHTLLPYQDDPGRHSDMLVYRAASGATVFSAGTIQWSWGLDDWGTGIMGEGEMRKQVSSQKIETVTKNILTRLASSGTPRGSHEGAGKMYVVKSENPVQLIQFGPNHEGWRSTWRIIASARLFHSEGKLTSLLFYDPAGEGALYSVDYQGHITLVNQWKYWRSTWRIITPGRFSNSGYSDLLFYDPTAGEIALYRFNSQGGMELVGNVIPIDYGLSSIIPGNFGGGGKFSDILVYDPLRKQLRTYAVDPQASSLKELSNLEYGGSSLQIVVPIGFSQDKTTKCLLYDKVDSNARFLTAENKTIKVWDPFKKELSPSWRTIVPGTFRPNPGPNADVLVYDGVASTADHQEVELYEVTNTGMNGFASVKNVSTITQIVAMPPLQNSKQSSLLFYDPWPGAAG